MVSRVGRLSIPVVLRAKDVFVLGSDTAWARRDGQNRVTHLERRGDNGPNVRYLKVADPGSRVGTARYVGAFYSPELDRTWWLLARNDSLILRRRDFADVPVAPVFADGFLIDGATLRFTGPAGRARELFVSNGRAIRVRFGRK